jgi:hypothetical protein
MQKSLHVLRITPKGDTSLSSHALAMKMEGQSVFRFSRLGANGLMYHNVVSVHSRVDKQILLYRLGTVLRK